MIQYIAYVGPKSVKRIQNDSKTWHDFPQGVTVDAAELGFSEDRIRFLIKSGVFRLRGIVDISTSMLTNGLPPQHLCGCGFVAKSKAGLITHQRHCK